MTELRRRVSLGNDLQQQHCELFYQSADVGGHVAGRRLHGKTRAKNCNEPIKKKWVNDEIHVLSGYLAQIHVLNRN